ncbi:MAG: magnesium/cobalt transporter CorA [Dehalococcoidia bacterium]|nr:magnesium/cobalt transporter CorA [Dehalococcoidia bacterium]
MSQTRYNQIDSLNLEQLALGELNWINIQPPTEKVREYLADNYPFHPLDLDDVFSRIQRPKMDEYKDYLFFVFNFPRYNKKEQILSQSQVSVFIGDGYLITLHRGELKPLHGLFDACQNNDELRQDVMGNGTGYLLYRILDRLIDYCLPILNKTGSGIEEIEDHIFSPRTRNTVREISRLRRDVISFRRTIWPMRTLLGGLEAKLRRFSKKDLSVYFGDMVDHLEKIWDGLNEYKEIIEGLHATHDSLASARINDVLRVLTILATIGTTLSVVGTFYGMNVALPGDVDTGNPFSWIIIMTFMLLITGAMLYYFYRKDWL